MTASASICASCLSAAPQPAAQQGHDDIADGDEQACFAMRLSWLAKPMLSKPFINCNPAILRTLCSLLTCRFAHRCGANQGMPENGVGPRHIAASRQVGDMD